MLGHHPSAGQVRLLQAHGIGCRLPPDRQPGDIPLAARLEQRRHRDPGVYRPGNNTLYFNNTTTTNTTDHSVAYGATGSVPVIGDWTGQ